MKWIVCDTSPIIFHMPHIYPNPLPWQYQQCVTYWPSTKPSIERCTCVNKQRNRCIQSKILEYHLDLWTCLNSVQMHTPTGSRWTSDNYITRCHRRLGSVRGSQSGSSSCSSSWREDPGVRASSRQRAWAQLSSPDKMRRKCCYG